MKKHLILAGGGHAHLLTLSKIHQFVRKGHAVTVVGPSPYHYYSGMGPGMLGGMYRPEEIRFDTWSTVESQGGRFLLDRVVRLDAPEKQIGLASGKTLSYDVISFNIGSRIIGDRPSFEGADSLFAVKPIENLIAAQRRILRLCSEEGGAIGIVGGGASAVETSGNVRRFCTDRGKRPVGIQILAGRGFLPHAPERVRKMARRSLERRGIDIVEKGYADRIRPKEVVLDSGERFRFDLVFLAHGIRTPPLFIESKVPTGPDGGLRVNAFLQSTGYPEIFGGGDCIHFQDQPLQKVGVYAVRQNPVLFENLMAALEERQLRAFNPGGDFLLIFNLGDGTGIFSKKGVAFEGRLAFRLKDFIDRRFMRRFRYPN